MSYWLPTELSGTQVMVDRKYAGDNIREEECACGLADFGWASNQQQVNENCSEHPPFFFSKGGRSVSKLCLALLP